MTITCDDTIHAIPAPPAELEANPDTPDRGPVDFDDLTRPDDDETCPMYEYIRDYLDTL